MSNWLQKFVPPVTAAKTSLPAKLQQGIPAALSSLQKLELTKGLPPATIVYGIAAGAFFAFAFYLMARHYWLEGLLTMLPAGCFVGFAVHLLKHGQPRE